MYFDATPLNMTTMLVIVVAVIALVLLYRGRYTSNMPLLFYVCAIAMATMTDHTVNAFVLYGGVALALTLRFEFMGRGFTKFIAILTGSAIALAALAFLDEVFGTGNMLS